VSTVLCVYTKTPSFPPTDQNPSASRFAFQHPVAGALLVDTLGGAPVQTEIDAVLFPTPIDQNDFQNLAKAFRGKCISDLAFRLAVAPGTLTLAQIQAERTRIKNIADALS
jgi:hypothetical protein